MPDNKNEDHDDYDDDDDDDGGDDDDDGDSNAMIVDDDDDDDDDDHIDDNDGKIMQLLLAWGAGCTRIQPIAADQSHAGQSAEFGGWGWG